MPVGQTLDPARGQMYWGDVGTATMRRVNLDGTGHTIVVSSPNGGLPTLDLAAGRMYRSVSNRGDMRRANLDGSGEQVLIAGPERPHVVVHHHYSHDRLRSRGVRTATVLSRSTLAVRQDRFHRLRGLKPHRLTPWRYDNYCSNCYSNSASSRYEESFCRLALAAKESSTLRQMREVTREWRNGEWRTFKRKLMT